MFTVYVGYSSYRFLSVLTKAWIQEPVYQKAKRRFLFSKYRLVFTELPLSWLFHLQKRFIHCNIFLKMSITLEIECFVYDMLFNKWSNILWYKRSYNWNFACILRSANLIRFIFLHSFVLFCHFFMKLHLTWLSFSYHRSLKIHRKKAYTLFA